MEKYDERIDDYQSDIFRSVETEEWKGDWIGIIAIIGNRIKEEFQFLILLGTNR